jgi:hypothetical protein
MSQSTIQGAFEHEEDLLRAAEAANRHGWRVVDIYTPYPLHATARVLGLKQSRLPGAALVFGALGVGTTLLPGAALVFGALGVGAALWFQFWTSAQDWPLNVGGRPWNSLPAFVPVTFEMMVLFAGLGLVLTWLVVCRLYPGKIAIQPTGKVTDDRFVLELEAPGPGADQEVIRRVFADCRGSRVEESEAP